MIQLVPNKSLVEQLPEPSEDQLENSNLLCQEITTAIKNNNNWLSFKDYMSLTLYHPLYGYYTSGNRKIGPKGDFITAPELGNLFAYSLSQQISPIIKQHQNFDILEFGAGSGKLAHDLLIELDQLNTLPDNYYILEVSAELKNRQIHTLDKLPGHIKTKIIWLDMLPEDNSFQGIIIANEVIDAMPVNLFQIDNNTEDTCSITELGLSLINNKLTWQNITADVQITNYIEQNIIPIWSNNNINYISEINFIAKDWLASIGQCIAQGCIFLIDYGFARDTYYHPDRNIGTLMCHYQHYAHQDPLLYPGLQDITAHVDFTSLAETAVANNLEVASFINQANFLLANKITDYISFNKNTSNELKLKQELKTLTYPTEMGELFKVLVLNKQLNPDFFEHLQPYDKRGFL